MLYILEGKKNTKPWIGPYKVMGRICRVGYNLKADLGDKVARVHANRIRNARVDQSRDPEK